MKIQRKLDDIFSRSSKVKVLRYLCREDVEQTGRGIARAAGISPSMAHSALTELVKGGVIEARKKGSAKLYRLRPENYAVKKLLSPLFQAEDNLLRDLIKDLKTGILKSKRRIINISIFGSIAARKDRAESDLDLLIVAEKLSDKKGIDHYIDELSLKLAEQYGIALSPYTLTRNEIKKKRAQDLPLIKSILDDNRLIYGEPIERILA